MKSIDFKNVHDLAIRRIHLQIDMNAHILLNDEIKPLIEDFRLFVENLYSKKL